jgi:hypothetical protein
MKLEISRIAFDLQTIWHILHLVCLGGIPPEDNLLSAAVIELTARSL